MYIYVEHWTPKQAWLDLSTKERQAFFETIMPLLKKHEEMGIETLAMARIDADTASKSEHGYFSVLRMHDTAKAKNNEKDNAVANWYDYFEQTNSRGEIRPHPNPPPRPEEGVITGRIAGLGRGPYAMLQRRKVDESLDYGVPAWQMGSNPSPKITSGPGSMQTVVTNGRLFASR